jgi:Ribonuclease G/E
MVFTYRVRGPYATALAKLVLDSGHRLSDLSEQLAQRLSMPPKREEVPQATVKISEDDPNIIVIVGMREAVEEILNIMIRKVPYINYEYNRYGPYTSFVAKIRGLDNGRCIAEYRDVVTVVHGHPKCIEGEKIAVHIVKPASQTNKVALAYPGIAIVKDTLVLLDDGKGKVIFSEHIRDQERKALLLTLSSNLVRQGYSIRWRSSARGATLEKIAKDLDEALKDLEKIKNSINVLEDIVIEGEAIAFITLTRPSKEFLDNVRNTVTPTILGHHYLRTCGKLSDYADLADLMSKYINREEFYKALRFAIADSSLGKHFNIIHRKPTGEKIVIGPIEIVDILADDRLGKVLVGWRQIKGEGVYNGLGVPKKQGDITFTLIPIDNWFIIHRYLSASGEEKGIYININTPPEICVDSRTITYLDLYADLVYINNKIELIDMEELIKVVDRGRISRDFIVIVNDIVDYIRKNIEYILGLVRYSTL